MADNKIKPKLKNIDDLFDGMGAQTPHKNTVNSVSMDNLVPFAGHPFRLYEGERLDDMVASVKANGVLVPIIVRKKGELFETLAGHNRVNAAKLAGLSEIPVIILENITDDEAMVYVVETNLIQRSFAELSHSEKAAVIALHHSKMFSQGKRNDILEHLKMLEISHEYSENGTLLQFGEKFHSDEKVAEIYSLSKVNVFRYLRIQKLIHALKSQLDNGNISFIPAVTISFLKENEQELLADCMEQNNLSVDMKKADILRQFSEKNKLNADSIYQILSGKAAKKSTHIPAVKIPKTVYTKYFRPEQSAKEVQEIIEKALDLYFTKEDL
jgi:ParB family chromosome partitioning protein